MNAGYEFVIATVLILFAAACYYFLIHRQGGMWVGYHNITGTISVDCEHCDGYGLMWLQPEGNHTRIVKIPDHLRWKLPDGRHDAQIEPAIGNLKECDYCRGMGAVNEPGGPDQFMKLPFPWPWRHL
jgi:hypothetical protein